jgi:hypothetical protein
MHLDISNDFDSRNPLAMRTFLEQGRILYDTQYNQQTASLLYRLQRLAQDMFGDHWGTDRQAFAVSWDKDKKQFTISPRSYYVGGLLCEPKTDTLQLLGPTDPNKGPTLIYLDVWEQEVPGPTNPDEKDPALGALPATTCSQLVWQLRSLPNADSKCVAGGAAVESAIGASPPVAAGGTGTGRGLMARINPGQINPNLENQLYRVEIHSGSKTGGTLPTFKWSRDNGSVTFALDPDKLGIPDDSGKISVTLKTNGYDDRTTLHEGDIVEYLDESTILAPVTDSPRPLLTVVSVNASDPSTFDLAGWPAPASQAASSPPLPPQPPPYGFKPFLRRWDQPSKSSSDPDYGLPVKSGSWQDLEGGVQVQFLQGNYFPGDYWLIPVRFESKTILWSADPKDTPDGTHALPPRTKAHCYAPLAILHADGTFDDCRNIVVPDKLFLSAERTLADQWSQQIALKTPAAQRKWLIDRINELLVSTAPGLLGTDKPDANVNFTPNSVNAAQLRTADTIKGAPAVNTATLEAIAAKCGDPSEFANLLKTKDPTFDIETNRSAIDSVFADIGKLYFLMSKYNEVAKMAPSSS